jgi:hypothetical protein
MTDNTHDDVTRPISIIDRAVELLAPRDEVSRIILRAAVVAAADVTHETGDPDTFVDALVDTVREAFVPALVGEPVEAWDCECGTGWQLTASEAASGCPCDYPDHCGLPLVRRSDWTVSALERWEAMHRREWARANAAEAERDQLRAMLKEVASERDDLDWRADMACENPPDNCGCAGCSMAAARHERGEI